MWHLGGHCGAGRARAERVFRTRASPACFALLPPFQVVRLVSLNSVISTRSWDEIIGAPRAGLNPNISEWKGLGLRNAHAPKGLKPRLRTSLSPLDPWEQKMKFKSLFHGDSILLLEEKNLIDLLKSSLTSEKLFFLQKGQG